jgi:hypothetical protein
MISNDTDLLYREDQAVPLRGTVSGAGSISQKLLSVLHLWRQV